MKFPLVIAAVVGAINQSIVASRESNNEGIPIRIEVKSIMGGDGTSATAPLRLDSAMRGAMQD